MGRSNVKRAETMNKAADTNTGLNVVQCQPSGRTSKSTREREGIHVPVCSVGRDAPRRGRCCDLDKRGDESTDTVQRGAKGVACAAVGCGEGLGGVSVENAVHLFRSEWVSRSVSHIRTTHRSLTYSVPGERSGLARLIQRGGERLRVHALHETVYTRIPEHRRLC